MLFQSTQIMREELLGRTDTVLANVEVRFDAGDASRVEVLPVRRDWAYINALQEVMMVWSDLQILTGTPTAP